jgi:hypothetical protein
VAEGAVVIGPCDEDEENAWAGRDLAFAGSSASVLDYYTVHAVGAGWTPSPSTWDDPPALCMSRPLGSTTAYLTVEVDGPDEGVWLEADADELVGC